MDKVCEFCKALRPVVYCKSDAANLCLSCDAKIHSANALSSRHSRTLLCESCRCRRAYIQCSTHQIFMCRACDLIQHNLTSLHDKREIRSYIGCPSARDLAVLWGFDLENCALNHLFGSAEVGIGSHNITAVANMAIQESPSLILQQILDLRGLQLSGSEDNFSSILRGVETEISTSKYDTVWKRENYLDRSLQQQVENPKEELNVESFSLQFGLLDPTNASSAAGNSVPGDSFWQCKSPIQSGQLWSQNMQDLGVCEELGYFDDMSIPDVDLTFRNFEEIFGGEQDPDVRKLLRNNKDDLCSSCNNFDESFDLYQSPIKLQDVPCSIQPSCSTSNDCNEAAELAHKDTNVNIRTKYKEKKVRRHEKQSQYASRKARADEVGKKPGSGNRRL